MTQTIVHQDAPASDTPFAKSITPAFETIGTRRGIVGYTASLNGATLLVPGSETTPRLFDCYADAERALDEAAELLIEEEAATKDMAAEAVAICVGTYTTRPEPRTISRYFAEHSAYDFNLVCETWDAGKAIEAELDRVVQQVYSQLVKPFDYGCGRFDNDAAAELYDLLFNPDTGIAHIDQAVSLRLKGKEPFPVATWQKNIKRYAREIAKLRNLLDAEKTASSENDDCAAGSVVADPVAELATQGLRPAAADEAGWYVLTKAGQVWATDEPAANRGFCRVCGNDSKRLVGGICPGCRMSADEDTGWTAADLVEAEAVLASVGKRQETNKREYDAALIKCAVIERKLEEDATYVADWDVAATAEAAALDAYADDWNSTALTVRLAQHGLTVSCTGSGLSVTLTAERHFSTARDPQIVEVDPAWIPAFKRLQLGIFEIKPAALDEAYQRLCVQHSRNPRWLTALKHARDYLAAENHINVASDGGIYWHGDAGHGDYVPTTDACGASVFAVRLALSPSGVRTTRAGYARPVHSKLRRRLSAHRAHGRQRGSAGAGSAGWEGGSMSTKSSPGPWTWNKGRPERYDMEWLDAADGTRVFSDYGNGKMTPNKLLIGAAPDLLAACEALDDVARNAKPIDFMQRLDEAIAQARAAIAKARGESEVA